jgi:hypothetical protein
MERFTFALTTDAGGAATVTSNRPVNGRVQQIRYVPDGATPLDTNADLVITGEDSGLPVVTLTNIGLAAAGWAPRLATHDVAGAAALYAAGGVAVLEKIAIANERLKVVVAQGGNVKTGTLSIWVG